MSTTGTGYSMRAYPMQPGELTEEQIAVIFAMTSRRPEPFDKIRSVVSAEKAADFNERWVLNYGHASVAEHAILHMAVENVSRLACDTLEDNRLASYTEKSSRYQVFPGDYYHVPSELDAKPGPRGRYLDTCKALFTHYDRLVEGLKQHLRAVRPMNEGERESGYALRLRREATDTARFVLPAATLTNVGVTMNARSMEHAITKLLSADLAEERLLGQHLMSEGRKVTPTLIKYAAFNDYLAKTRAAQALASAPFARPAASKSQAALMHSDADAERKIAAAFLYRHAHQPYPEVWNRVMAMRHDELEATIDLALRDLGAHDAPIRELESAYLTFEFVFDYGAYREFKRHRMQTYIPQPATTAHGYVTPQLVRDAGLLPEFEAAMRASDAGFRAVASELPAVAQYLVTHAHKRRVLATMNIRECYHLFKLRTQPTAHFSLVAVMQKAMALARQAHPLLFKHLRLRS
ncbi:MAG: hypothetical protein FJ318_05065 [SAR202 cluster bacterium]|nr:hypothetical protein [SAR202 cluster bacterium]